MFGLFMLSILVIVCIGIGVVMVEMMFVGVWVSNLLISFWVSWLIIGCYVFNVLCVIFGVSCLCIWVCVGGLDVGRNGSYFCEKVILWVLDNVLWLCVVLWMLVYWFKM